MMTKRSILVLDCTLKGEPSEGKLLKQFFSICRLFKPAKAKAVCYSVKSKSELLSKLDTGKRYDIIHISAHGLKEGPRDATIGNGSTWEVSAEEIDGLHHTAKLVFLNACVSDTKKMAEAFNSDYFIAPSTEVRWDDAALFSLMFYKRYVVDGVSIKSAFQFARSHTKTGKDYKGFWYKK
jgi:hypothetical protein